MARWPEAALTGVGWVSMACMAAVLAFVLAFRLVPAALAGLLVFSLMRRIDVLLRHRRLVPRGHARLGALLVLGGVACVLVSAVAVGAVLIWKARATAVPALFDRMADILDETQAELGGRWIPDEWVDADSLRDVVTGFLKAHAAEFKVVGSHAGVVLAHVGAGVVIGMAAAFHCPDPSGPRPLAAALSARLSRLLGAFDAVVFAQVRISLINTGLSAVYLYLLLPLFGVQPLPLRATLVGLTFFAGLLPVVGNLVSNSAVVLISLGVSPFVALGSLAYLVLVHKLEYFVNARIVGNCIHAQIWEVLLSMVAMEIVFGTPGLVFAPILYAYVKRELMDAGMV